MIGRVCPNFSSLGFCFLFVTRQDTVERDDTMKDLKTKSMILILITGLLMIPGFGMAQSQIPNAWAGQNKTEGMTLETKARLDGLMTDISENGYSYQVGVNPAMDFSLDQLCGLVEPEDWSKNARFMKLSKMDALPPSLDWRASGLPPVRNQGGCGSCWAFATVGALESQIMLQSGTAEDLSEQYLVSCNTNGWDCGGGWWAHDYHQWKIPPGEPEAGAVSEADFPYQASDVPCNPPHGHSYVINNWAYVGGVEPWVAEIKQAIVQYGPVSAGVAVGPAFQAYTGGVFDNDEYPAYDINHAIVLVGWDDNYSWNGHSYGVWILRNSWGPGWGTEGGYMYITYGTSGVGYSANYIDYVHSSDFRLTSPENGVSLSSPPTFSWTSPFDQNLFYTVFYYDLGFFALYRPYYFLTPNSSFTLPSNWWGKIGSSMPCYWTVCGHDGGWTCSDVRSFTKEVSE